MSLPQGRVKGHKAVVINTDHTAKLGSRQHNSVLDTRYIAQGNSMAGISISR